MARRFQDVIAEKRCSVDGMTATVGRTMWTQVFLTLSDVEEWNDELA